MGFMNFNNEMTLKKNFIGTKEERANYERKKKMMSVLFNNWNEKLDEQQVTQTLPTHLNSHYL